MHTSNHLSATATTLLVRRLSGLCTGLALALPLTLALHAPAQAVKPAQAAPDFTLRALNGPNLRLQELRGQVVMVNFWATWCGPCRQEMPHLNRLFEKYRGSGFTLLGVNVDEQPAVANEVARKLDLKFPVLLDSDQRVSGLYQLVAMPTTVLIDRDGRVRHVHQGYVPGYEEAYDKQVRELLK